jgi:hypothetical protein
LVVSPPQSGGFISSIVDEMKPPDWGGETTKLKRWNHQVDEMKPPDWGGEATKLMRWNHQVEEVRYENGRGKNCLRLSRTCWWKCWLYCWPLSQLFGFVILPHQLGGFTSSIWWFHLINLVVSPPQSDGNLH